MPITITDKFQKLADKMAQLPKNASLLEKLDHRLFNAQRIADKRRELNRRVVARLIPAIRSALSAAYTASGLKDGSGKLRGKAIGASIRATEHGILIEMDDDVAEQAGALQYGAVRNGRTALQGYDFFNIRSLDIESIYLKFYQEELTKEVANG